MHAQATKYASEVTFMDFTKHVMTFLAAESVTMPSANQPWRSLFYKLSKRPDAPEFLKRVRNLDDRVSETLSGLVIGGWLTHISPSLQELFVHPDLVDHQMRQIDLYLTDSDYGKFLRAAVEEAKAEFALRKE